ncbi:MAG TPA: hypothetical protein VHN14_27180 [Kofleriaceae bacterium]|nr:hypothetical protein [Kofleriaceae bacterium]
MRDRVRVACKLAQFPAIDDALRRGEVSYSKVRALVRVATPANDDRRRLASSGKHCLVARQRRCFRRDLVARSLR